MQVIRTQTRDPDFVALIKLLDEELEGLYGRVQSFYDQQNQVGVLETAVVGNLEHSPVACGCFKLVDGETIELKRMFVHKDYRGRGLSTLLLQALEAWAQELGYRYAILETGIRQHAAIALYRKFGYEVIENYDPYVGIETSICMRKKIV